MSEELVSVTANATNSTFNWANEWLGYMALGMFSMVLLVPTLGIVGLMVWEYFTDEAERKAERHREIEQVMRERYSGIQYQPVDDEEYGNNEDYEEYDEDSEANTLHKRNPHKAKADDFDCT